MKLFALLALSTLTFAQSGPLVPVGSVAPGFTASDDRGIARSLSAFRGKYVVLEWHEKGCPYVAKHYKSGAMQKLQAQWMAKGVVWLLVNSSSEGSHSFLTPQESRAYTSELKTTPTAMLLDWTGKVGKAYGVFTALHMVIINPTGQVIYNGAIDDQPKTEAASLNGARNYVDAALTQAFAGQSVAVTTSTPYGCEVHYAAR